MSFSHTILHWYSLHKRNLPWRNTIDPYKIWLSEIMLQQTRVAQGTPYYMSFVENFPTVHHLANASEEKVLKLWQGLGYYSRARNLHTTAKKVSHEFNGEFPKTYKELLKLKGIGDYTASAIASICFNEQRAVVDGNVYRVLARYFGIDLAINSTEGTKYFREIAAKVMHVSNIRDYNQAIMEFGALQCAPKNPNCIQCPLQDSCMALQNDMVSVLPKKINKTKIKNRFFNFLVVVDAENNTMLTQRKGKGIWQNLYQFPLLESDMELDLHAVEASYAQILPHISKAEVRLFNANVIVHKLSHQHLHTRFWIVNTNAIVTDGISFSTLEKFPVPVLISDFIKTFKNSYF